MLARLWTRLSRFWPWLASGLVLVAIVGCPLGKVPQGVVPGGADEETVSTGGTPPPDANQAAAAPRGPLFGVVLDESGKPAAGVPVTAYLSNSNPLIGNAGAGLAGNAGATYRIAGARRALGAQTKTDDLGRFAVDVATAGTYNLEAAKSDDSKAWQAKIVYPGGNDRVDAGWLRLAQTGSISGRVRSTSSSVKDFSNTWVFIPGAGYTSVTRSDGTYTIPHVPAGAFELGAYNVDLGDGALPDADNPGPIRVVSGEETVAGTIVLTASAGKLPARTLELTILPAGTSTKLQIFGVTIAGGGVTLNALPATGSPDPAFASSSTLRATVSSNDTNRRTVTWSITSGQDLVTLTTPVGDDPNVATVATRPGVTLGRAEIEATSVDDAAYFATTSIGVDTLGIVDVNVN